MGPRDERGQVLSAARAAAPIAVTVFFVGASFGVVARPVMGDVAPIVMSMIVFAGSAQFGATAVLADGGGPAAAMLAGVLLNARFLPMGIAVGPWLGGGPLRRALQGQAVVDASWALARRPDGRFDRHALIGATVAQYPAWVLGTVVGVVAGDAIGDPRQFGLDAVFPAFFLALLVDELRGARALGAALAGAVVALALIPVAPPGVPVLVACLGALLGLRSR